jgi:Bacteriophage tail sheath protein
MAQYLAPGVYVEEIPSAARPIAGVGTSTAGFIGVVADAVTMPPGQTVATAGHPQKISNWEEFKNKFGDFQAGNTVLAHAVFGFFNNGGTSCYVMRLATAADLTDVTDDLVKFEPIDEIAIVAVPGATTKLQQDAIANHCKKMEDRVAILDGQQNPANITVADIQGTTAKSDYAALYFPWIKVFDPATQAVISQPPSGHIAGVYARVDATRGVHKAPANEFLLGPVDLDRRLTKAQQGDLNPKGINVIRAFNGDIKIYGARTLGGDDNGDMRYISTRRFMNFLKESIDEGTQFVVFEPNNPSLWQRIIRSVSDFLLNQWRDGALFGETPKQAFFVKCDAETNPPSIREAGQVITEIGVAIVKPAEFVIFRIQQTTGS